MFVFSIIVSIIFSFLFFLIGYAYLNNKAEDILMWSLTGKLDKLKDRKGFKKNQGKYSIVVGIWFLIFPVLFYVIDIFDINEKVLRLWQVGIIIIILLNAFQTRKYFKKDS